MTIVPLQNHWTPASSGLLSAQSGGLEVRLAQSPAEIEAAMRLRHQIFREERQSGAVPDANRLDRDHFDEACDHLVVTDPTRGGRIAGTYRLLLQECTTQTGGFYSASMFDVQTLVTRHPGKRFLELGRSCVAPEYRGKRTLDLLWQGLWAYSRNHDIDVMIGSASLPGANVDAHAPALSFLHHKFAAEGPWRTGALAARRADLRLLAQDEIDARRVFASLPPLIKSYLRAGAWTGDGCVADADLDTTVVFIVLPVSNIADRYLRHYGSEAGKMETRAALDLS